MLGPGTLAPKRRAMPSSGWMRMVMKLGLTPWRRCLGVLEEEQRRLLELDGDLGDALGEALAGADVERDARPAPVLDFEAEGGVGLGLRAG